MMKSITDSWSPWTRLLNRARSKMTFVRPTKCVAKRAFLISFAELKAPQDFVRVSTHSVNQRVYLDFVVLFVEFRSYAVAFESFDPTLPLLWLFGVQLLRQRNLSRSHLFSNDSQSMLSAGFSFTFRCTGLTQLLTPCKVFIRRQTLCLQIPSLASSMSNIWNPTYVYNTC